MNYVTRQARLSPVIWLLLIPCLPGGSSACTTEVRPEHVKHNFNVVVRFERRNLAGYKVRLQKDSSDGMMDFGSALTDSNGIARFDNVPSGFYSAEVERFGISAARDVEVANGKSKEPAKDSFDLEWPGTVKFSAQVFSGTLADRKLLRWTPLPIEMELVAAAGTELRLKDVWTGKMVSTAVTDSAGKFELRGVLEGVYELSLIGEDQRKKNWFPETVLIRRDYGAKSNELLIERNAIACGVSYNEINIEDLPNIKIADAQTH